MSPPVKRAERIAQAVRIVPSCAADARRGRRSAPSLPASSFLLARHRADGYLNHQSSPAGPFHARQVVQEWWARLVRSSAFTRSGPPKGGTPNQTDPLPVQSCYGRSRSRLTVSNAILLGCCRGARTRRLHSEIPLAANTPRRSERFDSDGET